MTDRKKLEKAIGEQAERLTKLDPKGVVLTTLFESEHTALTIFPMSFLFMIEELCEDGEGVYRLIENNLSDFTDKSLTTLVEKFKSYKDADIKKLVKKAEEEEKASVVRAKARRMERASFHKGHISSKPKGLSKAFELWRELVSNYAPPGLGLMDVTPHDNTEVMRTKLRSNIELIMGHFGVSDTVRELCSNISYFLDCPGTTPFEIHHIPNTYPNYYGVATVDDNGTMLTALAKRDMTLNPGHIYTLPLDISGGIMANIELLESTFPVDVEVSLGGIKRNLSLIIDMTRAGRAHDVKKDTPLAIISY